MNVIHRTLLTVSGGRIGARLGGMPVYRVTTTGRTSGQARTCLPTAPIIDGDTNVFVASKGGDDRDPDGYRNLVAHPEFSVESVDGGGPVDLVARTAPAEEKADLLSRIVEAYQGYAGYREPTVRDIPVVVAEPSSD